MSDEVMLQEAINAAHQGELARARDLLTRLLRNDQGNTDYWLWMSAVVETHQEKVICLQNILKIDPEHRVAQRGLILLGARSADETASPVPPKRLDAWSVKEIEEDEKTRLQILFGNPLVRYGTLGLAVILVTGLIWLGVSGRRNAAITPTPNFKLTATYIISSASTLTPSPSPLPSSTPLVRVSTPTPGQPTPLWMLLEATHTATPLYVNTPHAEAEAYRAGLRAHERGEWDTVVNFMEQTIDIIPDAADAHYYLGEAHFMLEDYEAALESFENAIAVDEAFGPAYLGRARVRLALNPDADVTDDYANALAHDPMFGDVYLDIAAYWVKHDDPELALENLAIAESLLISAQIPLLRAQAYLALEQYEEARDQGELALELDLTQLQVYLTLGQVYLALGERETAVAYLETYALYETVNAETLMALGKAYQDAEEYESALEIFKQVLELDDAYEMDIFFYRGLIYLETGEPEDALTELNKANRLNRNSFEINIAIGHALHALDFPGDAYLQYGEALRLAETIAQEAQSLYYRAIALETLEETAAAIRDWEAILALDEAEVPEGYFETANEHIENLQNPTATPEPTPTPTASETPVPEETVTITPAP